MILGLGLLILHQGAAVIGCSPFNKIKAFNYANNKQHFMITLTENRKGGKRSFTVKQMVHGVFNSLHKRGFSEKESNEIIYCYIAHIGQDMNMSVENACIEIQKDFDLFIKFTRDFTPAVKLTEDQLLGAFDGLGE